MRLFGGFFPKCAPMANPGSQVGNRLQVYTTVYSYGQFMRFSVMRLRHRGRPLPKREWAYRAQVVGELRVEQLYDEELLRHIRIARLVSLVRVTGPEELPALYDPQLIAMSPQAFTLAGFERIDGADYAQSWLITAGSGL